MRATTIETPVLKAEGIVHRADEASRTLEMFVRGQLWEFEVPADCHICRGPERVPLRRLRALDHAWVAYEVDAGTRVARSVLASWLPVSGTAGGPDQGGA